MIKTILVRKLSNRKKNLFKRQWQDRGKYNPNTEKAKGKR